MVTAGIALAGTHSKIRKQGRRKLDSKFRKHAPAVGFGLLRGTTRVGMHQISWHQIVVLGMRGTTGEISKRRCQHSRQPSMAQATGQKMKIAKNSMSEDYETHGVRECICIAGGNV